MVVLYVPLSICLLILLSCLHGPLDLVGSPDLYLSSGSDGFSVCSIVYLSSDPAVLSAWSIGSGGLSWFVFIFWFWWFFCMFHCLFVFWSCCLVCMVHWFWWALLICIYLLVLMVFLYVPLPICLLILLSCLHGPLVLVGSPDLYLSSGSDGFSVCSIVYLSSDPAVLSAWFIGYLEEKGLPTFTRVGLHSSQ